MHILDFGAGFTAMHTTALRAEGLHVTAHDFGRNFVPGLHDPDALKRRYHLVFASNVLNVHISTGALRRTIAQIAAATRPDGSALVNYPETPRKLAVTNGEMEDHLDDCFYTVRFLRKWVWQCTRPRHGRAADIFAHTTFFPEEIAAANIRPAGAVGKNAIIPRLVRSFASAAQPSQSGQSCLLDWEDAAKQYQPV